LADAERTPAWRFGWLWPTAAAAATLLVALAVWVGRTPPSPEPRVAADAVAGLSSRGAEIRSRDEGSAIPAVETAAAPGRGPVTRESHGPAARAKVPRAGESLGAGLTEAPQEGQPEVLVPPREAEALLRFAAHLRTRVIPPDSLLVADLSAPLPEPQGVEIHPLEIVPLDPAETSGTD